MRAAGTESPSSNLQSHWWWALVKVLLVKYLKLVMFGGSQSPESDDVDSGDRDL